jgi:hypothetical protein
LLRARIVADRAARRLGHETGGSRRQSHRLGQDRAADLRTFREKRLELALRRAGNDACRADRGARVGTQHRLDPVGQLRVAEPHDALGDADAHAVVGTALGADSRHAGRSGAGGRRIAGFGALAPGRGACRQRHQ